MKTKKIKLSNSQSANLANPEDVDVSSEVPIIGKVLILHGPNLNMLGLREPHHYGPITLDTINSQLAQRASALGIELLSLQSNHEGILIDRIQQARLENIDFIIINPAGYTHSSVAMRDALSGVAIPFVEVHLSNIYAREKFRHHSYFSDIAIGVISGLGAQGYIAALEYCYQQFVESS